MKPGAALLAILLLSSCKDAPAPPSLNGTWGLARVNEASLPYTVNTTANSSVRIVGGTLTIAVAGTFTLVTIHETRVDGVVTDSNDDVVTVTGSVDASSSAITLNANGGETWSHTAELGGSALVVKVADDRHMEYTKQ